MIPFAVLQVNKRTAEIATLATEEIKAEIEDLRESLKEAYQLIKKYKNDDDVSYIFILKIDFTSDIFYFKCRVFSIELCRISPT